MDMCLKPSTTDQNRLPTSPPSTTSSKHKEVKTGPDKLVTDTIYDGSMTKMKFKSKYNTSLNRVHKVEMQLKQAHSK